MGAYLASCAKIGKSQEKLFSGKATFQVDPDTHAQAALAAQVRGIVLNQSAEEALGKQAAAKLTGV